MRRKAGDAMNRMKTNEMKGPKPKKDKIFLNKKDKKTNIRN